MAGTMASVVRKLRAHALFCRLVSRNELILMFSVFSRFTLNVVRVSCQMPSVQ